MLAASRSTRTQRRSPWTRARAIRLLIVVIVALILLWATLTAGAARLLAPRIAERFSSDAEVQSKLGQAAFLTVPQNQGAVSAVTTHARRTVDRDPTLPAGWRLLALERELAGQIDQARALYLFAERLSRRDVASQIWLIEDSVRRNDIPSALTHYDRALSTSPSSWRTLLPILAAAADNQDVAVPLVQLLRRQPIWGIAFLNAWSGRPPPPRQAVQFLHLVRANTSLTTPNLNDMGRTLAARGEIDAAFAVSRLLGTIAEPTALVQNGGFDRALAATPFDWTLQDAPGVNVRIQPQGVDAGSSRLEVDVSSETSGAVATQILRLRPGQYRFRAASGAIGNEPRADFRWNIACISGAPIASFGPQNGDTAFLVPVGCAGQRLTLTAFGSGTQRSGLWVDAVGISPVG